MSPPSAPPCSLQVVSLTVDYLDSPLSAPRVTDSSAPLLGWALARAPGGGDTSNMTAASYRIVVASSIAGLDAPDLWDSGVVASRASVAVPYGGAPLPARARAFWRVAVVDSAGGACAASAPGAWEVPLLSEADWRGAAWVAAVPPHPPQPDCAYYNDQPAPLLRATFSLAQPPAAVLRARLYIGGLGYFVPYLDGTQVGDEVLAPGWTDFNTSVAYSTHDVTAAVSSAREHVLGVALGNGWWNLAPLRFWGSRDLRAALPTGDPMARALLAIDFLDGSSQSIVTAPGAAGGWAVVASEVLFNSIYLGTRVDRRLEPVGWATLAFNASGLPSPFAPAGGDAGVGGLRSQRLPPVRRQAAVSLTELPPPAGAPPGSTRVFDLGRQVAGVCEWHWAATGLAGRNVSFLFGELLHADGSVNGLTSVAGQIKGGNGGACAPAIAYQVDSYVLRGDDSEVWTPPFTWHAGRYVQITGADALTTAALDAASSRCFPLRSDIARVGSFSSSSPLLNAIHAADVTTYEANMMSVQSDCPARERLGYGGDVLMSHEAVSLNFDTTLFYEKRVDDFIAAQRANGGFTETAPFVGISDAGMGDMSGPIGWQTVVPVLADFLLARSGNMPLAQRAFPAVARYAALLAAAPASQIEGGLGDWMCIERPAVALTGRGFEYMSYASAADLADAVNNHTAADAFRSAAAAVAAGINAQFLDAATGIYAKAGQFNSTQCGQALPLYLGLVPPATQPAATAVLLDNIAAHGGHLQVGGFGVKWLLMALSDAGRADIAWQIMNRTDFPGFGYMLNASVNGLTSATTVWESWFTSDNTYSHDHAMFTSGEVWMYEGLAGIRMSEPTWAAVRFAPAPPPPGHGLDSVNASIATPRGLVSSAWTLAADGTFVLTVCVPPNVRATVRMPGAAQDVDAGTCCGCTFNATLA